MQDHIQESFEKCTISFRFTCKSFPPYSCIRIRFMETLNNKMLFYWGGGGLFQAGMKIASIAIICNAAMHLHSRKTEESIFTLLFFNLNIKIIT